MSVATLPFPPQSTTRRPFRRSLSVGCESSLPFVRFTETSTAGIWNSGSEPEVLGEVVKNRNQQIMECTVLNYNDLRKWYVNILDYNALHITFRILGVESDI